MKSLVRPVVAALLASAALVVAGPAAAQKPAAAPAAKPLKLSKPVMAILAEVQKLQAAGDFAGSLPKLAEAMAVPAPNADDTFATLQLRLNAAIKVSDNALIEDSLNRLLATGRVLPEDQPKYLRNIGAFAMQRKDYAAATTAFEKLTALDPNNAEHQVALAELYYAQKQGSKAVEMLSKAVATSRAAGQAPPENWFRRRLAIAYDGKLAGEVQPAALALVGAFPNPVNWRDAIIILRDGFPTMDDQTTLDFLRLQAATGSLTGERDYVEYADTALGKGYPGEAQFALNEGIKRNMLSATKPIVVELKKSADSKVTADKASLPGLEKEAKGNPKLLLATGDAYYGYGDFAKAAALYKQAVGGATVDQATANLRLGAALARSGDAAGAEAALAAVKGGAREALAQYWLAYLKAPKA